MYSATLPENTLELTK